MISEMSEEKQGTEILKYRSLLKAVKGINLRTLELLFLILITTHFFLLQSPLPFRPSQKCLRLTPMRLVLHFYILKGVQTTLRDQRGSGRT